MISDHRSALQRPTASQTNRVAVIGAGHLGRIHTRLLASNHDVQLVAVADPLSSSRQWIEQNLRVPTVADYTALEGTVDAVVIAAPTNLHHEIATWWLKRGIHTFIEKPIASTRDQAEQLVHLARRSSCVLQVGHVERFNPAWATAVAEIESHSIRFIESAREGTYTGRSTDISIVMDLMIHDIDLILSKIESPLTGINAFGWNALGEHADFAVAHLLFRNGCLAQLRASRVSSVPRRQMLIFGEYGFTEIDFAANTVTSTCPFPDVASRERQADRLPADQRAAVKDQLFEQWLTRIQLTPATCNAIEQQHLDFLTAIKTKASPRVDGEQALKALVVAAEIEQQIRIGNSMKPGIIPAAARFAQRRAS